jgi:arginine decarboxylase-like protein
LWARKVDNVVLIAILETRELRRVLERGRSQLFVEERHGVLISLKCMEMQNWREELSEQ